jgi:predicted XRE-type DNA-binding protein
MEMRAQLLMGLEHWLEKSRMTQAEAAKVLGVTQARVSELKRGKIDRFSMDLLVRLAACAGLEPKLQFCRVRFGLLMSCRLSGPQPHRAAVRLPSSDVRYAAVKGMENVTRDPFTAAVSARGLEQEPAAMLGLVDPVLDEAGGSDVAILVAQGVCASEASGQQLIVFPKLHEHVPGGNVLPVVIGNALKPGDVPDRMQGRSSDLSDTLGNRVGCSKYLPALFVQKQMVIAEMRSRYMPMKVLGLEV